MLTPRNNIDGEQIGYIATYRGVGATYDEVQAGVVPYERELMIFPGGFSLATDDWLVVVVERDTSAQCLPCAES